MVRILNLLFGVFMCGVGLFAISMVLFLCVDAPKVLANPRHPLWWETVHAFRDRSARELR